MNSKWVKSVKIKHLLTFNNDYESLRKSMKDVAKVLKTESCFSKFNCKEFEKLPKGDQYFKPLDYANRMLNRLYDFADQNRIWIE